MSLDTREILHDVSAGALAAEVLKDRPVIYAMGMWLEYRPRKNHYEELTVKQLTAAIWKSLNGRAYMTLDRDGNQKSKTLYLGTKATADIREALIHLCLVEEAEEFPFWLDRTDDDPDPRNILVTADCLVNWETLEMMPRTRRFVSLGASEVEFDPFAEDPTRWLAFLGEIFDGDQEQIDLLHEVMGAIIFGVTKHQKAFQLFGPPRSGKGTIGKMIGVLLGKHQAAFPTMGQIKRSQYIKAELIGKRAAMVMDARISRGQATDAMTETILSMSGEDVQTVERKYRDAYTGRLFAQWFFFSNEPVLLTDFTGAIATRFVLMETRQGFLGRENLDLWKELEPEASGVLNLCLDGLHRMLARGQFLKPASLAGRRAEIIRMNSSIAGFANEHLVNDPSVHTPKAEIFEAFEQYLVTHDLAAVDDRRFWKDLRTTGKFNDKMNYKPRIDGVQVACAKGLRLVNLDELKDPGEMAAGDFEDDLEDALDA